MSAQCNCHTFGSAKHCEVHTQADYDAQRQDVTTVTVEHAILCDDGRVHYRPSGASVVDLNRRRQLADRGDWPAGFCGGPPHVLNARQRTVTVTAWEPVQTGVGAA